MKSKILITGSEGFIGSCLINNLNNAEYKIYTSDYTNSLQYEHIYPNELTKNNIREMDIIVHLGAISETNSIEGNNIFQKNIISTLNIIDNAKQDCQIIYASSASVYGADTKVFEEEGPKSCTSQYSKSKLIIDNIVTNFLSHKNIIGLRFFNVCSFHNEDHKLQPSPTYKFLKQLLSTQTINLFYGSNKIYRDFIFIDDVINIIKFFLNGSHKTNIFNVGSGISVSFEEIADSMIEKFGFGTKIFVDRPSNITTNYQEYTCANITKLKQYGYAKNIPSIIEYIKNYA
jgi:ADP-L-glycero-D-manno-heptose 6-epimerase